LKEKKESLKEAIRATYRDIKTFLRDLNTYKDDEKLS
jgi:hypothetical protein